MKKEVKKFIILILVLSFVLVGLIFNQKNNQASAQFGSVCKEVIPIGEAAIQTLNLYSQIFALAENIDREMESLTNTSYLALNILGHQAKECKLSNCTAVCENISPPLIFRLDLWFSRPKYPACVGICGARKPCQGRICPDLRGQVETAQKSFQNIESYYQKLRKLIGPVGQREETEEVTEDIAKRKSILKLWQLERTVEGCLADPTECPPEPISLIEWIERKLERTRAEFRKCATPRSEWPKYTREGLFVPNKSPVKCQEVLEAVLRAPAIYQIDWAETKCNDFCNPTSPRYNEKICAGCLCGKTPGQCLRRFCDPASGEFDQAKCQKCRSGQVQNWLCCQGE